MVWIEGRPGEELPEVWAYLSLAEARYLRDALQNWDESGPDLHVHIPSEADGLTIAIGDDLEVNQMRREADEFDDSRDDQ